MLWTFQSCFPSANYLIAMPSILHVAHFTFHFDPLHRVDVLSVAVSSLSLGPSASLPAAGPCRSVLSPELSSDSSGLAIRVYLQPVACDLHQAVCSSLVGH